MLTIYRKAKTIIIKATQFSTKQNAAMDSNICLFLSFLSLSIHLLINLQARGQNRYKPHVKQYRKIKTTKKQDCFRKTRSPITWLEVDGVFLSRNRGKTDFLTWK